MISICGPKLVVRSFARIKNFVKNLKYMSPLSNDCIVLSGTQKFVKRLRQHFSSQNIKISFVESEGIFTKFEGSQMGYNPAFWAQNQLTGELFYVKYGSVYGGDKHLESEVLASKLYNLAGIETPTMELGKLEDGTICIISKYIPDLKELTKADVKAKESFAADAWLANWDSLISGNTLTADGKCIKIDNGGALKYRALGELKPNFGDKVDEVVSLVESRNYESACFYGDMSKQALINSFKKVTSISDASIKEIVKDEQLAKTLINRKKYMQRILNKIESTPYDEMKLSTYLKKCVESVQTEQ